MVQVDVEKVRKIIQEAGDIALEFYSTPQSVVEQKPGGEGPVTEADKAVDRFLRHQLTTLTSKFPVISEESNLDRNLEVADTYWLVDPIDGTLQFIERSEDWAVMVALIESGRPTFGAVYQPATQTFFWAQKSKGAFKQIGNKEPQRIQTSPKKDIRQGVLAASKSHPSPRLENFLKSKGIDQVLRHGSVGLKMAKVACGEADFYFNFAGRCQLWDLAPGDLILSEAQGQLFDLSGQEIKYSHLHLKYAQPFLAASESLMPQVLEMARTHWSGRQTLAPKGSLIQDEKIYVDGVAYFNSLLEEIVKAREYIDLETYIFDLDDWGRKIFIALTEAADRGVKIRLMVDGFGSFNWPTEATESADRHKIELRIYHPLPWNFSHWQLGTAKPHSFGKFWEMIVKINRRNHRKTCVIDGRVAFLGSFNISAVHCNQAADLGQPWRDTGIRIEGGCVHDLRKSFDNIWFHRGLVSTRDLRRHPVFRFNTGYRQHRALYSDLLKRIASAKKRVWITNAYFIPEERLLKILEQAAKQGVDVEIILPRKTDVPVVRWSSITFYTQLIKRGVRIFEYLPVVLHAKVLIIDDWVIVGSSNMNQRSILRDNELDVVIQQESSILFLEDRFLKDREQSQEITVDSFKKISGWRTILGRIFLLFRSVM